MTTDPVPSTGPQQAAGESPWVKARAVAEQTGRRIRIVYRWVELGCPHRKVPRGNKEAVEFQVPAVAEWLKSQGLDVLKPRAGASPADEAAARATRDIFDTMAPVEPSAASAGAGDDEPPDDDGDQLERLGREIDKVLRGRPKLEDAGAMAKWAASLQKLSQERRQLEEHRFEIDRRAGKFVERSLAREMMASLGVQYVSLLDAIASSLPVRIWTEVIKHAGATSDQDAFVGVAARAVAAEIEDLRLKLVDEINRAVSPLEADQADVQAAKGEAA